MEWFTGAMVVAFSLCCGGLVALWMEVCRQKALVRYYKGKYDLLQNFDDVNAVLEDGRAYGE